MTASSASSASSDDDKLRPLTTDALIEQRVASLIGRAVRRQLWVLFLNDELVQLPLIVPIDDLPVVPPAAGSTEFATALCGMAEVAEAASIVLVWERYGGAALTAQDKAWALSLHDAGGTVGLSIRAMLLSHRGGVRWIAQDDFRFEANLSR
ncbi:MAG: hypothetical protein ACYCZY_09115 [Lacisediminihabitans sp.]